MTREHAETVRWLAAIVCQMADAYLEATEISEETPDAAPIEEESEPDPEPDREPEISPHPMETERYRAPPAMLEVVNRRNATESPFDELKRQNNADWVSWLQTVDLTNGKTMVQSMRSLPRGQRQIMSRAFGWQINTWDTAKGKWIAAGEIQSATHIELFREAIEQLKKEYNA